VCTCFFLVWWAASKKLLDLFIVNSTNACKQFLATWDKQIRNLPEQTPAMLETVTPS
jgi:hypothetical protein